MRVWAGLGGAAALAAVLGVWAFQLGKKPRTSSASVASSNTAAAASVPLPTNEVAQAIMVTVELDFGGKPPSIKDALKAVFTIKEGSGASRLEPEVDANLDESTRRKMIHKKNHLPRWWNTYRLP